MKCRIDLIHSLNMTIIAKGIKTVEQSEIMQRLGYRVIQGYFYYLQLPKSEVLCELLQGKWNSI